MPVPLPGSRRHLARPKADASAADEQALTPREPWRAWRKRLGVEPSLPRKEAATDFEDREGHRAPFTSGTILFDQ